MTRIRLREAYDEAQLREVYARPHEHTRWPDHQLRVAVTIQVAYGLVGDVDSIADLSCGDAAIVKALVGSPSTAVYLGDFAPGYDFQGPIEKTIEEIPHVVDLFVCSETVEHLDDPGGTLKAIRRKTDALVLSTPVGAWQDRNPEHYWAWSRDDVDDMLVTAGFTVAVYNELDCRPGGGEYAFGIWGCR